MASESSESRLVVLQWFVIRLDADCDVASPALPLADVLPMLPLVVLEAGVCLGLSARCSVERRWLLPPLSCINEEQTVSRTVCKYAPLKHTFSTVAHTSTCYTVMLSVLCHISIYKTLQAPAIQAKLSKLTRTDFRFGLFTGTRLMTDSGKYWLKDFLQIKRKKTYSTSKYACYNIYRINIFERDTMYHIVHYIFQEHGWARTQLCSILLSIRSQ